MPLTQNTRLLCTMQQCWDAFLAWNIFWRKMLKSWWEMLMEIHLWTSAMMKSVSVYLWIIFSNYFRSKSKQWYHDLRQVQIFVKCHKGNYFLKMPWLFLQFLINNIKVFLAHKKVNLAITWLNILINFQI